MAYKRDYHVDKEGYITEIRGYQVLIPDHIYITFLDKIIAKDNSGNDQVLGFLMGRAEPDYIRVECSYCAEVIKKKDLYEPNGSDLPRADYGYRYLHNKCHEKVRNSI